jgi:uncharacterized protein YcaQ
MGWWERSNVEVKLLINSYTTKKLFSRAKVERRNFLKSYKMHHKSIALKHKEKNHELVAASDLFQATKQKAN